MLETLSSIVTLLLHIIDPQKPDGRARGPSAVRAPMSTKLGSFDGRKNDTKSGHGLY